MSTDFKPFLDPIASTDSDKYVLDSVWVSRGFRYASDRRIIIREETTEPDSPDLERRPAAAYNFKDFPTRAKFDLDLHNLKLEINEHQECVHCDGRGQHCVLCTSCFGEYINCKAKNCKDGFEPTEEVCRRCGGQKYELNRVIIGGNGYAGRYIHFARALPGMLIRSNHICKSKDESLAFIFSFNGQGLIAPFNPPAKGS